MIRIRMFSDYLQPVFYRLDMLKALEPVVMLKRLLAEGVSKTKQADGEIHEDQLLNFLVNRLTRKFFALVSQ